MHSPKRKKTKRFDAHKIDTEFFRKLQRHKNKQKTRQAHCSDPKSDGKHKHKTDDFNRGKSPSAIQTVSYRASSKKRSEVQTDNCTDKRNQSDTDQSQFFLMAFKASQSYPISTMKFITIKQKEKINAFGEIALTAILISLKL